MKKLLITAIVLAFGMTTLSADGKALFGKCIGCHGMKAEKKALGKSKIIKGWSASKIEKSLKGYKDGTYGRAMKGLMKGQIASYNNKQIKEVAKYISTLK